MERKMAQQIEILIVDDHIVVREGLKRILSGFEDIVIVAEAANVPAALVQIRKRSFDLILLDVSLPGRTGLELLSVIKAEKPQLPVLILSAYTEDQYALRALRDGADGFLNKESAPELLVSAIRKVASGGKYVSAAMAERLALAISMPSDKPVHEALSERELLVLRMIAVGKSLNEIAESLHISPKTVTTYRTRIIEKTHLKTNAELIRYALEQQLVS
jgi:two-component system, NarL family, invasion response regulator UvrY